MSANLAGDTEWEQEKSYREEVLKFLCNGNRKLFRSVTEGDMYIYLSNISLTPKQELGRNLYSFSAQAT
jgi:hypothetical protein